MKFLAMISRFLLATAEDIQKDYENSQWYKIVNPIVIMLDQILIPIIIIVGVAGAVYGIVLGVQWSKAETTDKKDEVKKKLINGVIGVVIALVILIGMKLFLKFSPTVAEWITTAGESG